MVSYLTDLRHRAHQESTVKGLYLCLNYFDITRHTPTKLFCQKCLFFSRFQPLSPPRIDSRFFETTLPYGLAFSVWIRSEVQTDQKFKPFLFLTISFVGSFTSFKRNGPPPYMGRRRWRYGAYVVSPLFSPLLVLRYRWRLVQWMELSHSFRRKYSNFTQGTKSSSLACNKVVTSFPRSYFWLLCFAKLAWITYMSTLRQRKFKETPTNEFGSSSVLKHHPLVTA